MTKNYCFVTEIDICLDSLVIIIPGTVRDEKYQRKSSENKHFSPYCVNLDNFMALSVLSVRFGLKFSQHHFAFCLLNWDWLI